jgi:predicted N-acyltransferase
VLTSRVRCCAHLPCAALVCSSSGLVALAERLGVSSVYVTFAARALDGAALGRAGFLPRLGEQYHWRNDGVASFEDYLASLKQGRRKAIRQERRKVRDAGILVRRLRGEQIREEHMRALYRFYARTTAEKWGSSYLAEQFFLDLRADTALAQRTLLVLAEERSSGELVAGALNLVRPPAPETSARLLPALRPPLQDAPPSAHARASLTARAPHRACPPAQLGDDCVYGRLWGCARR